MEDILIIEKYIKEYINNIDSKMNSKYVVIDSKKKGRPEAIKNFESEKLLYSLVNLGIPFIYSLRILDVVISKIIQENEFRELETSSIRKAVSDSLYESNAILDEKINLQKCRIWGDLYLRKYGNPEGPIKIIHRDGRIEELNFELLSESIIPNVFSDILEIDTKIILRKFSKKERQEMGNELMRIILELGIYRLHHRTLLLLARDLAMQPPHPWIFDPDKTFEYIQYNLERANKNMIDIKSFYEKGNIARCQNPMHEIIHHASAAILGFYGEIPGCGLMAPFRNLYSIVDKLRFVMFHPPDAHDRVEGIKEEINLFGESKMWTIIQDLNIHNIEFDYFYNILKEANYYIKFPPKKDDMSEIIPKIEAFLDICTKLVYGKEKLKEELDSAINYSGINKDKGKLFEDVVEKIFCLPRCFSVKRDVRIKNKQIDMVIEHKCDNDSFLEVKKHIFVECKNIGSNVDVEVVEKLGKRVRDTPNRYCNTGIIVSAKGFTRGAINEAISYFDKGVLIILLKKKDLFEMIEGDIIKELSTKIDLLFYGKIE